MMSHVMELAPSEVREIILAEHKQLRVFLGEIEALLKAKSYQSLRPRMQEFDRFFLAHIGKEDKILRPVLKDLDAWGDVRVDRMNQEHAEQRARVRDLDQLLATGEPSQWAPLVQKFITDLYTDMEAEERECLNPDVLKDDPITVQGSG